MFDLPQAVFASILPCISSDDWLAFRLTSRGCYEIVHGTKDVNHSFCHLCQSTNGNIQQTAPVVNEEAENLWNLALVREYRFSPDGDNLRQSIHSPAVEQESFLSTRNVFTAPTSFISWKHWRKLEARRGDIQSVSADGSVILRRDSRIKSPGRQVVGSYYLRAAELWKKIDAWLEDESVSSVLRSNIRQSLKPGRDMATLQCVEFRESDVITALVAIYSFYSGQLSNTSGCGLFGGYSAYDFGCNMIWCLFDEDRPFGASQVRRFFPISDDTFESLGNGVYMDLASGGLLFVNNQNRPVPAISSDADQNRPIISRKGDPALEDSLIRWFEEHARRLSSGYYSIGGQFDSDSSLSILHYPSRTETALCSLAVTRGIEVVASSTYNPFERIHIYSIRIRLIQPQDEGYETPEQRGFITAQLHSRYWIITKQTESHIDSREVVRGEGVIGEYPLLLEGGYQNYSGRSASVIAELQNDTFERRENNIGAFTYQSCTDDDSKIFEGHLIFYPGSLYSPTGDPFRVRVAPFPLSSRPEYYF
jgi:hypothetical protein